MEPSIHTGVETALAARPFAQTVSAARTGLIVLGIAFAIAGVVVASAVDALIGIAVLIVGAFLLTIPFTRDRDEG